MPVIFNEPLSFLQRVVEYMEYGGLLERASACDDPIERHEVSWHQPHYFLILQKCGICDSMIAAYD